MGSDKKGESIEYDSGSEDNSKEITKDGIKEAIMCRQVH